MVMNHEDGNYSVAVDIPVRKLKANNKYPGALEVAIASYIETQAEALAQEVISNMDPFDEEAMAIMLRERLAEVEGWAKLKNHALRSTDPGLLIEVAEIAGWTWDLDRFDYTSNGWKGPNNE